MIKTILAGVMVFLAIATADDKLIYVLSYPTTSVAIPPNPVSGIASELPTVRPEHWTALTWDGLLSIMAL